MLCLRACFKPDLEKVPCFFRFGFFMMVVLIAISAYGSAKASRKKEVGQVHRDWDFGFTSSLNALGSGLQPMQHQPAWRWLIAIYNIYVQQLVSSAPCAKVSKSALNSNMFLRRLGIGVFLWKRFQTIKAAVLPFIKTFCLEAMALQSLDSFCSNQDDSELLTKHTIFQMW